MAASSSSDDTSPQSKKWDPLNLMLHDFTLYDHDNQVLFTIPNELNEEEMEKLRVLYEQPIPLTEERFLCVKEFIANIQSIVDKRMSTFDMENKPKNMRTNSEGKIGFYSIGSARSRLPEIIKEIMLVSYVNSIGEHTVRYSRFDIPGENPPKILVAKVSCLLGSRCIVPPHIAAIISCMFEEQALFPMFPVTDDTGKVIGYKELGFFG